MINFLVAKWENIQKKGRVFPCDNKNYRPLDDGEKIQDDDIVIVSQYPAPLFFEARGREPNQPFNKAKHRQVYRHVKSIFINGVEKELV